MTSTTVPSTIPSVTISTPHSVSSTTSHGAHVSTDYIPVSSGIETVYHTTH